MDQAQSLSRRERFKQSIKDFWRAHIVDDDPYDALENDRFEALIRAVEASEAKAAAEEQLKLVA